MLQGAIFGSGRILQVPDRAAWPHFSGRYLRLAMAVSNADAAGGLKPLATLVSILQLRPAATMGPYPAAWPRFSPQEPRPRRGRLGRAPPSQFNHRKLK